MSHSPPHDPARLGPNQRAWGRRGVLATAGATVSAVGLGLADEAAASSGRRGSHGGHAHGQHPDVLVPVPMPAQAPQREGYVSFGAGRLWYWDTGGSGEPIVLMHAGSGGGNLWGYQQPVLSAAGYRVVGYSRRGYRNSDAGDPNDTGTVTGDLNLLLAHLGLDRVHLVATAGGSISAAGYALTHPDRVRTLSMVCSLITVGDPDYVTRSDALRPAQWSTLPVDFQELGPSYRAADRAGAAAWVAASGTSTIRQGGGVPVTAAALAQLRVPMLIATGDADLYTPPAMLRELAAKIPRAESYVIPESGHSAYWERPHLFNAMVLDFIKRNRRPRRRS